MAMRIGFIALVLGLQVVPALCGSVASAAPCVNPPLPEEAIARFRADPTAIVTANADTRTIEARVMELAGTSATLATDLVRVARGFKQQSQPALPRRRLLAIIWTSMRPF
jgi:hypothetical protein